MRWAGVDVGGRRKGFHAVVIDAERLVAPPLAVRRVGDVVRWLAGFGPALTAVDSPITAAPSGSRLRECERELKAAVCGIRWTPSLEILQANRPYYEWVLHGLELHEALDTVGLETVECFPTASWTRWGGPRASRTRARWTREVLASLVLKGVPERTNQDERDAIAAAVTARAVTSGLTERYGEIAVPLATLR